MIHVPDRVPWLQHDSIPGAWCGDQNFEPDELLGEFVCLLANFFPNDAHPLPLETIFGLRHYYHHFFVGAVVGQERPACLPNVPLCRVGPNLGRNPQFFSTCRDFITSIQSKKSHQFHSVKKSSPDNNSLNSILSSSLLVHNLLLMTSPSSLLGTLLLQESSYN